MPRDVSLVSFDDPDYFEFLNPSITCVAQPTVSFGREAARLLTDVVDGGSGTPTTVVLSGELRVRKSVART